MRLDSNRILVINTPIILKEFKEYLVWIREKQAVQLEYYLWYKQTDADYLQW